MENIQEKTASFFRFEDLRVYDKAIDYSVWLLNNLQEPKNEGQKQLSNSFFRSANDMALNIAEGSAMPKNHFNDYLKIAKTALRECVVYTELAHACHMLEDDRYETSRELLMELTRMLGALIISLSRGHHSKGDYEQDEPAQEDHDEMDELKF